MPVEKHRVVIDTNLWISFLLTRNYERLDNLFAADKLTLLVSQELINESVMVTERPKFRRYFDLVDLSDLLTSLYQKAEFVVVSSIFDSCRDAKDNFLLSLAVDGNATHILTGDRDLLILNPFEGIQIIPIADYLATK